MQEANPRMQVGRLGSTTIVELTDRKILDEINISQIGDQLAKIVSENKTPRLVLDFANVAHMSSSALGMLITLHKRVRERSGSLRLCNIQPSIYEVFVITRLNEIFQICASRDDAINSMD